MSNSTVFRKGEHLDLCLHQHVDSGGPSLGLGEYTLEYDALPELDFDEVDLSTSVCQKQLKAPLIIGAMTGGTDRAREINGVLARAASSVGVGMALGSQRVMIEHPEVASSFKVRDIAPDLPLLLGNIGAVQLNYGVSAGDIAQLLETVQADALNIHLNPLQEAIQPEGDTRFGGLWERLNHVIPQLKVPTLVKEVGAGISSKTAEKLARLPIFGIEVAGTGGTSWAKVEGLRAPAGSPSAMVGERLRGFGVNTANSIQYCRAALGDRLVVASGGIRTGMDIAVALALGADVVALARPFLKAAAKGEQEVINALQTLIYELRVISFCTGAKDLKALRGVRVLSDI